MAKREQELAAIQAAATAAQELPVTHKRYTDSAERARSIQEMVVSHCCGHLFHVLDICTRYFVRYSVHLVHLHPCEAVVLPK